MKTFLLLVLSVFLTVHAEAKLIKKTVEYDDKGTALEGYVVYDDAIAGERPGILVVHNWYGFGANNDRADMLAQLGYVAFAVDIYGKGIRPKNADEAGGQAGIYKGDRKLFREKLLAGLEAMKNFSLVDPKKMAAVGYCFGGTGVMELARAGADVKGVVSFHGGLDSPTPEDGKNIKAKILALHGADDPFVPEADLKAFEDELKAAQVDYQIVKYSGAKHSFTDKTADSDAFDGTAYNANADRRSWKAMQDFFKEIFEQ